MSPTDEQFITIVSGLPRSGTSLMMRMLDQGGLPVLVDGYRKADDDNPLGYYEFELVKRLPQDQSWLPQAYDKALKIIYIFLYYLPPIHKYKVVFMNRNLDEIIASQKKMLRRRNEGDRMSDQQLVDSYNEELQKLELWLRRQENFSVLYLNYSDVVANPATAAFDISRFLHLPLDTQAMIESVDPSLHRNRATA